MAGRTDECRIAFVAGESSGDLLAAPVVQALRAPPASCVCAGVAGERMIAAGCEPWHHVRELSVSGYVQVLPKLPGLLALRRELAARLRGGAWRALVGVDSPDFNLGLETRVRAAGVPTIHYVSPSIWAWRGERIERIRRAADRVLLVFPFEQEIYARAGIAATYVGHPLASQIALQPDRAAARARLGLDCAPAGPVFCLMPGSRRAEIACIAPVFFAAAQEIARREPGARFLLPVADPGLRPLLERIRQACLPADAGLLRLVDGRSHDCLEACDGVLVASGTATLEAALFKRPMVIVYRVPRLTAWIMRRIGGYLPWVGLPNILARETLVPELLQEQATGPAIAREMLRVVDDTAGLRRLQERFGALHESLRRDTPALASAAILQTAAQCAAGRR